ncbi:MAG: hypothetical protein KQI62_14520 [Deltaproteobacteria bacterium]|nr:hypothetical protein [Deltaproteobacteria bacterium]
MRSIVIDELRPPDMEKLISHLEATLDSSGLPDVFWLQMPEELLTPAQREHAACGPHRVAVVLELDSLKLELLVRASQSLRCSCTGYADDDQRQWLIDYVDDLIEQLQLQT